MGDAAALGPGAADVRLVRRAAQLRDRPDLRPPRRGPDRALLARRPARDGEGHPQVPRRDLARPLLRRRPRAAAADGDPRLPADGREKDVEEPWQRPRPVRGDRPLRRRRAALLPLPRGQLRPGRLDLHRRLRAALRDRARQRLRQPRQPGAGDGRPLSRRAGAGRAGRRDACRGLRRRRRPLQRAARPGRAEPGARPRLGPGPPPQPLRRGNPAVGAGQGRGRSRAARRGPLQPGRGTAGDDAAARPLPAGHDRDALGGARRRGTRAGRARLAPGRPAGGAGGAALPEDRGAGGLMAAPVLAVSQLHKRYGSQDALAGVDLEVEAGQLVGLLGPNGAGKSTLTKIACGLVRPSAGTVEVLGRPAGSVEARAALGYLAELFRFPGWLSAAELLRFHQRLVGSDGGEAERRHLLDLVELGDAAGKRVEAMSKGMQQRLGIAQALVGSPRLLLLDEPTSALDPVGRRIVRELLEELRRRGVSVLLNSHLLSEVELICDHVAIIARGRLVKAGTPQELAGPTAVVVETGSGVRTFAGA